ncbi:MAG TPA: maleylpyruvate isomerase family mycothiol-dependent enzyme [Pseudonocardiaceae bacterium]|nr:maleylpyruvate isomerase family mycothiol-dependent enzyme [Pseudonocardiaceae bacterium]
MDVPSWIKALRADGELLAEIAAATSPDAKVPGCPEWQLRDLLAHVGRIHRWAGAMVAGQVDRAGAGQLRGIMTDTTTPADGEIVDWFRTGHRDLVETLEAAPADLDCFTFLPAPSALAFWARRQAHETAVHRVDAEQAAGRPSRIDPAFAADGVDELLIGFLPRNKKLRDAPPRTLLITTGERHWRIAIGPDLAVTEVSAPEPADATISGAPETLYLALWNRLPWHELTVTGDENLPAFWAEEFRV